MPAAVAVDPGEFTAIDNCTPADFSKVYASVEKLLP
jgi:hypothetical protein